MRTHSALVSSKNILQSKMMKFRTWIMTLSKPLTGSHYEYDAIKIKSAYGGTIDQLLGKQTPSFTSFILHAFDSETFTLLLVQTRTWRKDGWRDTWRWMGPAQLSPRLLSIHFFRSSRTKRVVDISAQYDVINDKLSFK